MGITKGQTIETRPADTSPTPCAQTLQDELTAFYTRYDSALQRWIAGYDRPISCHKGCSTCCDLSVGLYLPEAIVLARILADEQYAEVAAHAQRVIAYARGASDYLAGYRDAGIGGCPFLDRAAGACRIYTWRPANCRHVYANLPSAYCARDVRRTLAQDPARHAEFLRQLDPRVNEDDLPFIAPLQDIFHDHYEIDLMRLNAKYFNVIAQGEMSWFITLAREHHLWELATGAAKTPAEFQQTLQRTGCYHEQLLTDCQEIRPNFKKWSIRLNWTT